jgi:DNA-binding SARP family transcriptional activator
VRVRILGDVEVVGPDGAVTALTPLPAAVLCRLLVADGGKVSADTLLADLWSDREATGTGTVRVTVARVRRVLQASGLGDRLVTRSGGWSLSIDRQETDVGHAAALVEQAAEARRRGRVRDARVAAATALGMLSGSPLANVPGHPCFVEMLSEVASLTDRADVELIECELALGRAEDCVAHVVDRASHDLLDEAAVILAVRALAQVGRQAEAIEMCHRHAEALAARGLVVSETLRSLELMVLRHDTARPRPSAESLFVGRDRELEVLAAAWNSAASRPGVVMIEGRAGIGKTRLVTEFVAGCVPLDVPALMGSCGVERSVPLAPFVEALATDEVTPDWTATAPDGEVDDRLTKGVASIERLCRLVLERVAAGGVLVIDDAQWMDDTSVSVLRTVVRRARPGLLVVLTVRTPTDDDSVHLSDLASSLDATRLEVTDLTDDEAQQLLVSELRSRGFDGDVDHGCDLLRGLPPSGRGSPFVVRSLARSLGVDGDDARSALDPVEAAVSSMVGRLSRRTSTALAAAAVLGQRFSLTQLAVVAGCDVGEALDAVEEAIALGLVVATDSADLFEFDHDIIRRSLEQRVSTSRRAVFHLRAADLREAHHGADAQVVFHLREAGPLCTGERLGSAAAEAALRTIDQGAVDLARSLVDVATAHVVPDSREEANLCATAAAIAAAEGRYEDALASIVRASDLAVATGHDELLAVLFAWRAAVGHLAPTVENLAEVEELRDRLRPDTDRRPYVQALLACSTLMRALPRRGDARATLQELQTIADRRGDTRTRLDALYVEHDVLFVECAPVADRRRVTAAIDAIVGRSGDRFDLVHAHLCAISDALGVGDVEAAVERWKRLDADVDPAVDRLTSIFVTVLRSSLALAQDRLDGLDELVPRMSLETGGPDAMAVRFSVLVQMFVLRWAQGRLAEMEPVVRAVAQVSDLPLWTPMMGLAAGVAGSPDHEELTASAVRSVVETLHRDWLWLPEAVLAAEACARWGTVEDACELVAALLPVADLDVSVMQGSVADLGPVSRPLAVLLDRVGRHDEARRWAQHAAERTGPGGAVLWARVGCRLDH